MASDLLTPKFAISNWLYYNERRQTPAGTTNFGGVSFLQWDVRLPRRQEIPPTIDLAAGERVSQELPMHQELQRC